MIIGEASENLNIVILLSNIADCFAKIESRDRKVKTIICSNIVWKHLMKFLKQYLILNGSLDLWGANLKLDKELNDGFFILE